VREDQIKNALGDPVPGDGQRGRAADSTDPPRRNNGITGDGRRSSADLGKRAFDLKVDDATRQIQELLAAGKSPQP
jgi:creatinine amidohydrolase/Fe(II)-dependent formamide hydrolase-like protein